MAYVTSVRFFNYFLLCTFFFIFPRPAFCHSMLYEGPFSTIVCYSVYQICSFPFLFVCFLLFFIFYSFCFFCSSEYYYYLFIFFYLLSLLSFPFTFFSIHFSLIRLNTKPLIFRCYFYYFSFIYSFF